MSERICAILSAKRAVRTKLDAITVAGGYTATITWTDRPVDQNKPVEPPDPQGADDITVTGELIAPAG